MSPPPGARGERIERRLESTSEAAPRRSATPTFSGWSTATRARLRKDSAGAGLLGGEDHERRPGLVPVFEQVEAHRWSWARRRRPRRGSAIEPALGVQRQRAAQRGALLLAVDLEGVGARLGPEHDAAPGPQRRAAGAGAGAAGALLAPGLGAAAGDHCARLGGGGAAPASGLLGAHALVHERTVEARREGVRRRASPSWCARQHGSVQRGLRHRRAPPPPRRAARAPSRARAAGSGGVDRDDLKARLGHALVAHLDRARGCPSRRARESRRHRSSRGRGRCASRGTWGRS